MIRQPRRIPVQCKQSNNKTTKDEPMKTLFSLILVTLSLNSFAANIDFSGLHSLEIEAIQTSNNEDRALLIECLIDNETMIVDETSCINEVFGDVHN